MDDEAEKTREPSGGLPVEVLAARSRRHRLTGAVLCCAAVIVAACDFLIFELKQDNAFLFLLLSTLSALVVFVLSIYALVRTTLRVSLLAIASLALVFSVWMHGTPSRLRFAVSKPYFVALVPRLESGEELEVPRWIGLFYVKKLQRTHGGQLGFWTAEHPYGDTGIVYCPDSEGPAVNIMLERELTEDWHYVCID